MKETIRQQILTMGADVCGFADVPRFQGAPEGFHPTDVYADCKTVIVFGIALPKGIYEAKAELIYAYFNNLTCPEVDRISFHAAKFLEAECGAIGIPVPCDCPYEYWDQGKLEGRGMLSMKHAAVAAGLGTLGKNTLLLSPTYGNRLIIGVVLTDLVLDPDPLCDPVCIPGCHKCLDACPVHALNGVTANQALCRPNAYGTTARGFDTVHCKECRIVCPLRMGKK